MPAAVICAAPTDAAGGKAGAAGADPGCIDIARRSQPVAGRTRFGEWGRIWPAHVFLLAAFALAAQQQLTEKMLFTAAHRLNKRPATV